MLDPNEKYGWPSCLDVHYLAGLTPAKVALRKAMLEKFPALFEEWEAARNAPCNLNTRKGRFAYYGRIEKAEAAIVAAKQSAEMVEFVQASDAADEAGADAWRDRVSAANKAADERLFENSRRSSASSMPGDLCPGRGDDNIFGVNDD